MENTFLHFNNEDTFQNQKSEIKNASVSFVKDSGKLYTHGEEYDSVNWGEIKLENGVYVYTNIGQLIKPEAWNTANNDNAVGVAVIDDNCKFVITKGEKPKRAWSDDLYGTDVSGLINYTDDSYAITDFNGENNTAIIREAASGEDASNNAAHYCYNQTISINGRGTVHGYLPAFGELQAAYNNKSAIDSAISLIGGTAMPTRYLWSSTEFNSNIAWYLRWDNDSLDFGSKNLTYGYAVPFFPLNL